MTFYTREEVKDRKHFYRDHYRSSVKILVVTLFIIAALMLAIAYKVLVRPEPHYYATANDGGLTKLSAIDAPNMGQEPLID